MQSLCCVHPHIGLLVCRAGPAWAVAGAAQCRAYKEVPLPGEQRVCGDVHQHVQGAQQHWSLHVLWQVRDCVAVGLSAVAGWTVAGLECLLCWLECATLYADRRRLLAIAVCRVAQCLAWFNCYSLEARTCAAACAHLQYCDVVLAVVPAVLQIPTQNFFTDDFGLPLTMKPDFETLSCDMIFGQAPPPLDQDPVYGQSCLSQCSMAMTAAACPKTDTERQQQPRQGAAAQAAAAPTPAASAI